MNKILFTLILIGVLFFLKGQVETFNSGYRHHKSIEFHPAERSFGRTSHIAELNDAVNRKCNPQGEYYTMRYTAPRDCVLKHSVKQFPYTVGYYNTCGKKI